MLAHKTRGAAANLGLERLADALARLEQQAADAGLLAAGALDGALAAVAEALDGALGAIRAGSPSVNSKAAAAAAGDSERARRAGRTLLQALRRGALDDASLSGLVAALAGHPAAQRVAQVQAALADFDFELALAQLEAVLAALDDNTAQEAVQ
jgi:HPt (histidine-containing phosphotransfer) domain-containing protein